MTSARRRPARGVRRWVGLVLVAAAAATWAPSGAHAASPRAELRLTSLSPVTVQYGTTLRAAGTFATDRTVDDVTVRLEIGYTAFVTRSAISAAAANPPLTTPLIGATDDLGKVKGDTTESFRIAVKADDLPFSSAGVYPLRVVAVDASTGEELSDTSTFLPWAPEGIGVEASRLLMFWPVMAAPARDDTGAVVDDGFAASLSPTGRLGTLVRSGERAPATWLVDPAVLEDAGAVGDAASTEWLDSVATAARTRDVVALPYGDPDVAAVAAAGRPSFLHQGQTKGDQVFSRYTGTSARNDLAWPADGAADDAVISTAARADDSLVLLDEEVAPLTSELPYTPSGRIAYTDPAVDVLLADAPASALVATPASTTTDVLLARQRFLAETLLHALELPPTPRLLVVAPPRRWDPSPLWADTLVSAIRRASWLNPVSLDQAVRPSAPTVDRVEPTIPEESAARQLPATMVDAAQQGLADNRRLAAILTRPRQLSAPIEDALFTSLSTAWRVDPSGAATAQQGTLDRLAGQRSKVRIVTKGGTLADDSGSFPVSLRNQLDQTVVVRLSVTSTDTLRLRVNGPDDRIRIPADGSVSEQVELDAVTSGRLSFEAQLLTPGGAAYDDPVTLSVDVRGFGQITLVVFGAAIALLILAATIRVVRRIRGARGGAQ